VDSDNVENESGCFFSEHSVYEQGTPTSLTDGQTSGQLIIA